MKPSKPKMERQPSAQPRKAVFGGSLINLYLLILALAAISAAAADLTPSTFTPFVWKSEPPADCPFEPSKGITGIEFLGLHSDYRFADTWYPSWAADGNLYSPWTDGSLHEESCSSDAIAQDTNGFGEFRLVRGKATTGQAVMTGRIVTYMKNFGEQAYFVNLPSKFISADGRTAWLCYSGNFAPNWNGEKIQVNPPGARYGLVLQKIRLTGSTPP